MPQTLVGLTIVGPALRHVHRADAATGDLLQVLRHGAAHGQAVFAQPLGSKPGMATRGLQRLLCRTFADALGQQPGQRFVAGGSLNSRRWQRLRMVAGKRAGCALINHR